MGDISLLTGDIEFELGDFKQTDSIINMVLLSLFIDGRVPDDFGYDDPRGYYGTVLRGEHEGSWLWTLQREKITAETIARANDYSKNATQWIITQGLADDIIFTFTRDNIKPTLLNMYVEIIKDSIVIDSINIQNIYNRS